MPSAESWSEDASCVSWSGSRLLDALCRVFVGATFRVLWKELRLYLCRVGRGDLALTAGRRCAQTNRYLPIAIRDPK